MGQGYKRTWAEYLGFFLTIFVPGTLFVQSGEGYGVLRLLFLSTDKKNTEEYKGKSSWDGGVGGMEERKVYIGR